MDVAEFVACIFVASDGWIDGPGAEGPVGGKGLEAGIDGDAVGVGRADDGREHGHGVEEWNLADSGVCFVHEDVGSGLQFGDFGHASRRPDSCLCCRQSGWARRCRAVSRGRRYPRRIAMYFVVK